MALQSLLATLIVATLGLTAYVGSVSREIRQLVYGTSSYAQSTACTTGQLSCPDATGHTYCYSGTTCPTMTTTTDPATGCANAGGVWCPVDASHTYAWCAMSGQTCASGSTSTTTTTTGSGSCTGGQVWCTSSSGGSGWCQTSPCPANDSASCTAQGGRWCGPPPAGGSGWCQTGGGTCPAYTSADCSAQGGRWCSDSSMSSGGWCQTGGGTCPTPTTSSTTCPSGQWRCYSSSTDTVGWCSSSTCPTMTGTGTPACTNSQIRCFGSSSDTIGYCYTGTSCPAQTENGTTACTTGQISCYNSAVPPTSYCYTGTTCPSPNPSCPGMYSCPAAPPATGFTCSSTPCSTTTGCSTGQQWCPPSGNTAGYCAATCLTPIPTGPTPESCKAQNQYYCAPTATATGAYPGTTSGWCSSTPCTSSECVTAGKKWCDPMPMTGTMMGPPPQGWCTEKTNTCPAYTQTACEAQGSKWCKNQVMTTTMGGSNGWCQTGGGTCPAYDDASCKAQGGSWCAPSSGGMGGWCATPPSTCPNENKDKLDCAARGGDWCLPMSGGFGWCATGGSRCPANDSATCSARGGKWCKNPPSTYSTAANMPSGWCSEPPSGGSATSTYWQASCPIYDATECRAERGVWCAGSGMGGGWCWTMPQGSSAIASPPVGCNPNGEIPPGPKVCPLMPYVMCPKGYNEVIEKNQNGCTSQRCVPPGGEDLPRYCPTVMPPPCPGGTLQSKPGPNNCPIYECRASECKPPPPAEQCVTGWQPIPVPGLNCPRYDCPNTDHDRTEECVRKAIGEAAFLAMKNGTRPTPELMLKMEACWIHKPPMPRPPGPPRPPGEPPFPDQCPLADMKREMQRGMTRELERIDHEVDRFRRQKVEIPVTYEGLLAKVKLIISQASAATSCEEMYTFGQDLPDLMRQLHEEIQGIEQLARVTEVVKKFKSMLDEVERDGKRALRRVPKDLRTEMQKEFDDKIAGLKVAIESVRSAAASNDPDKVEAASQQAFEQLEQARQTIQVAEMLRTARRVLNAGRSDIKRAEKLVKELGPEESADLTEALAEFKLVYAEALKMARTCSGTKATEACSDLFERYLVAWDDLKDAIDDAAGESNDFDDFLGFSLGEGLQKSKTLDLLEGVR